MKNAIKQLSYVLFPRRCQLCGEVVRPDEKYCRDCRYAERINGEICLKCAHLKTDCACSKKDKKPTFNGVVAPFYFRDSVSRAVHRFKFYGYTELADNMAREMTNRINESFCDINFDFVTFVPLSKRRYRKRGYNQAELLAQKIADRLSIPCLKSLNKIRETETQRGASAKERRVNLFGAFDLVDGFDIDGKTVLLVDDVKTTGSTLNECSEILKAYGAKAVYCSVFAVTKRKKKNDKK